MSNKKQKLPDRMAMPHEEIRWNPALEEWFCVRCGRTSDHVAEERARKEIDEFECMLRSVEV